jgi:hypothetical protein
MYLEPIKVDKTMYLEPIKVDKTMYLEPIKVDKTMYLEPIKVDKTVFIAYICQTGRRGWGLVVNTVKIVLFRLLKK